MPSEKLYNDEAPVGLVGKCDWIVLLSALATSLANPTYVPVQAVYNGPLAPIGKDGRVIDTPEVAHAKATHLAALAEASSRNSYSVPSYDDASIVGYSKPASYSANTHHIGYGYQGPKAPLDQEGRVVDTPEVANAKAEHFAAYSSAVSNTAHAPLVSAGTYPQAYTAPAYGQAYRGPAAPLAQDGRVAYTPEVAHARAAHLAAYANTLNGQ
ncbi:hypothetical protein KM043_012684 [Ampulex compressa]|nr:hypothetical protein KM043_012684 [Ampulex compressa]